MKHVIVFVYTLIPFKKQLLSIIRLFWIPGITTARHLHFKGMFNVPVNASVSFKMKHYGSGFAMESDHFWRGACASEPYSVKAWMQYATKSDLIMDIGANTGSYTLIAAALHSKAEIHAFEPVKRICEKLTANCLLNGFSVAVHNTAVSDEAGTVFLTDQGGANEYMSHVSKEGNEHTYAVKSIRLDMFEASFQKSRQVLMKIDVEGHEAAVLSGMGDLFRQVRPIILLEVLTETAAAALHKFFDGMDYVLLNIDEAKGYRLIECIEKSDDNNIFCCPAEKYESLI